MDFSEKATNEKRLIDANAFLKDILTAGIGKTIIEYSESDIGYMIRKRPTIDAVPIVRCEKCKHAVWDEEYEMWKCVKSAEYDEESGVWFGFCEYHNVDFFCADGERKDGDK